MANPELSQRIQELPEELLGLEREPGIAERLRRIDVLKDRARALAPLDGVEDMALADYDRDRGIHADLGGHVAGIGGRIRPIGLAGQIRVRRARRRGRHGLRARIRPGGEETG